MRIALRCGCGAQFQSDYDGLQPSLPCPKCRRGVPMVKVPQGLALLQVTPDDVLVACACKQKLKLPRKRSGQKFQCPQCQSTQVVPMEFPPAAARPAAAAAAPAAPQQVEQADFDLASFEEQPAASALSVPPGLASPPTPPARIPSQGAGGLDLSLMEEPKPKASAAPPPGPATASTPGPTSCPSCKAPLAAGAAICVQCGFNLKTGAKLAGKSDDSDDEEDGDQEGLNPDKLLTYFNTKGGIDSAKAGIFQVINGIWLYLPVALISVLMAQIALIYQSKDNAIMTYAVSGLEALIGSFMFCGLIACVRDGIFQRDFGIERLLYNGVRHWPSMVVGFFLNIPLWILVAVSCFGVVKLFSDTEFGLVTKILLALAIILVGVLWVALVGLLLPAAAILEGASPFKLFVNVLKFSLKNILELFLMAITLFFICGASFGVFFFIYQMASILSIVMPEWVYSLVAGILLSIISTGLLGEILASLMLLYLSHIEDYERLRSIQKRMKGPPVSPLALKVSLAVLLAACIGLGLITPQPKPDWEMESEFGVGEVGEDLSTDSDEESLGDRTQDPGAGPGKDSQEEESLEPSDPDE